jgi:hypothetical protein
MNKSNSERMERVAEKLKNALAPIVTDSSLTPSLKTTLLEVLEEITALLKAGKDPKALFELLFIQNNLKHNLGLICACLDDSPQLCLKYLALLQLFLEYGINVKEMHRLLMEVSKNDQHLGIVIGHSQKAPAMSAYFDLLETLLVNGLPPKTLFEIIELHYSSTSLMSKVIRYQNDAEIERGFKLIESLIKKGVMVKSIRNYIASTTHDKITREKFLKYLLKDIPCLYQFLRADLLPDWVYPLIKDTKQDIVNHLKTVSRDQLYDACLQYKTKGSAINRYVFLKRYWWWLQAREGHGTAKFFEEEFKKIQAEMDQEDRVRVHTQPQPVRLRQPERAVEKPIKKPVVIPQTIQTAEGIEIPSIYPQRYVDANGEVQWTQPQVTEYFNPPPSFVPDVAQPSYVPFVYDPPPPYVEPVANVEPAPNFVAIPVPPKEVKDVKEGVLIDFSEPAPAPKIKVPENDPFADLFPAAPTVEPVAAKVNPAAFFAPKEPKTQVAVPGKVMEAPQLA